MLCVTSFEFPIDRWSPLCFLQSFLRAHTLGFSARAITVTHISLSSERKWKLWRRRDVPRLMSIIIDEPSAARRASSRGRWCEVDEHFPSDREKKWKFSCVPEKLIHYITDLQWSLSLTRSRGLSTRRCCCCWSKLIGIHNKRERARRGNCHIIDWLIDWLAFWEREEKWSLIVALTSIRLYRAKELWNLLVESRHSPDFRARRVVDVCDVNCELRQQS